LGTDKCDANAKCIDTEGSYTCICNPGYSGNGFTCNEIYDAPTCDDNNGGCGDPIEAECFQSTSGVSCSCRPGFSGSPPNCFDIEECLLGIHSCDENAECLNGRGYYNCSCNPGYIGDGFTCTDIGACAIDNGGCGDPTSAVCVNAPGGILCACRSGYSGTPPSCFDINECADSSLNNCSTQASCTNTNGSYICNCHEGYYGNGFTCSDAEDILETIEDIGSNINPVPRLITFWWHALQNTATGHHASGMPRARARASYAHSDAHIMNQAIRKMNSIKKAYLKRRIAL